VLEAEEFFSKGQKGSSAMPHKRNPVISERICGLARVLRSNSIAALENVALWHERDISHSSVERIIIPDSCIGLDYMLDLTVKLVKNLIVYPDNMLKNLNLTKGLIFSQNVLLRLTDKGVSREDAYRIVQTAAMKVWEGNGKKTFEDELLNSPEVTGYLSTEEIKEIFNYKKMLKNVDYIFARSIEQD
jgi:adenylosuccinate lyase